MCSDHCSNNRRSRGKGHKRSHSYPNDSSKFDSLLTIFGLSSRFSFPSSVYLLNTINHFPYCFRDTWAESRDPLHRTWTNYLVRTYWTSSSTKTERPELSDDGSSQLSACRRSISIAQAYCASSALVSCLGSQFYYCPIKAPVAAWILNVDHRYERGLKVTPGLTYNWRKFRQCTLRHMHSKWTRLWNL